MTLGPAWSLEGRVALVTGASRGIGAAIATAFSRAGARVVLMARSAAAVEALAATLRSEGFHAHASPGDVTSGDDRERAVAVALAQGTGGRLDVLVNNAGMVYRAPAEEFPESEWRRALEVNLTAPFLLSQSAARVMIPARSGSIINIGSLSSILGGRRVVGYTASKGGLALLTKALANDWAQYQIRVNAIAPGYIRTDMNAALREDPSRNAEIVGRVPLGRWGEPGDLVGAAVFLASDASAYMTAQTLYVDGGYLSD